VLSVVVLLALFGEHILHHYGAPAPTCSAYFAMTQQTMNVTEKCKPARLARLFAFPFTFLLFHVQTFSLLRKFRTPTSRLHVCVRIWKAGNPTDAEL